jgi:type IV pilus assembly protein PilY1
MSNLVDANGDQEWVALFGNGYNSTSGTAKLFVLFLDRGVDGTWCHPDKKHNIVLDVTPLPAGCATDEHDFIKIDTTFGVKNGLPNGLGTPRGVDIDGNGTLDYAYAGDTFGNFFRFDLTSDDFNDWSYTKIFKAEYVDSSSNVIDQPITTQPILVAHPSQSDGYIVIFGTGSYMTVPDGPSLAIQSMYGLWDRLSPTLITKSELVQQRYTNKDDPTFGNVRVLSDNVVDYSIAGGKKGWFNDLDSVAAGETQGLASPEFPGERAIRNIQVRGGRAFVNSVIPRSNTTCVDVAGGFALAFCPGTGSAICLGDGIFDLNNDGDFDTLDEVDNTVVAGIRFEEAVPTDSAFIGDTRVTQLSNQDLETVGTNTNYGSNLGRLSWKQLESID